MRSCYKVEPVGRPPNLRVSFSSSSGKRNEAMGSGNGAGGARIALKSSNIFI